MEQITFSERDLDRYMSYFLQHKRVRRKPFHLIWQRVPHKSLGSRSTHQSGMQPKISKSKPKADGRNQGFGQRLQNLEATLVKEITLIRNSWIRVVILDLDQELCFVLNFDMFVFFSLSVMTDDRLLKVEETGQKKQVEYRNFACIRRTFLH